MNNALMAKLVWNFIQPERQWWLHFLPRTYRPWDMAGLTPLWESITQIRHFFEASVIYVVGSRTRIRFWDDSLIGMPLKFQYPNLYLQTQQRNFSVSEANNGGDRDLGLQTYLTQESMDQGEKLMQHLQNINIEQATQDVVLWKWEMEKYFSVKSFYKGMEEYPVVNDIRGKAWNIKAPPRVMVFIWLMLRNMILTVDNLVRRGWQIPNRCALCQTATESVEHLFNACRYTAVMIQHLIRRSLHIPQLSVQAPNMRAHYTHNIIYNNNIEIRRLQVVTCFVVWRERCKQIFREENTNESMLAREILDEYISWFSTNRW